MASTSSRQPTSSVFIGNIGVGVTEEELTNIFKQAGPVKSFRLVIDKDTGKTKGYAFAEYFDVQTAQTAQRNLNGHEINGRSLRVDFADTDKDKAERSRGRDRGQGLAPAPGPRPVSQQPAIPQPVGPAAQGAGHAMSNILGGSGGAGQQQITDSLSKMSRTQIYEIMNQMKSLIQQNPQQARQILVQNPQLTKALFQAQILLGMVQNPLANGVSQQSEPQQGPPPVLQPPQQQQHGAPIQLPAPQIQHPQPQGHPGHPPIQLPAPNMQPNGSYTGTTYQPAPSQPGYPPQALPRPQTMLAPVTGTYPVSSQPLPAPRTLPAPQTLPTPRLPPPAQDPRQQAGDPRQAPSDPRQLLQPQHSTAPQQLSAPQQQQPLDPRQQPIDPRQQQGQYVSYQQQPQPVPPTVQTPQAQPAAPVPLGQLGADQQRALLQQVMSLTPEQINLLPEQQKQQVLTLQQQLRGTALLER